MRASALTQKKKRIRGGDNVITDADVKRVLRLLKNAQFDLGRKTDSVKLIRKERD